MRPKAMSVVLGRLAGCKMWQMDVRCAKYTLKVEKSLSRVSEGTCRDFVGVPLLRFGHERCFAVIF